MSRGQRVHGSLPPEAMPLAARPVGVDAERDALLVRRCREAGGFPRVERLPDGSVAWVHPGRPPR